MTSKSPVEPKNIEKPRRAPSPRPFILAGYTTILLTFGVIGGWAAVARLDKAVIAHGVIDVASNRREIQHLEGGIIGEILAGDGARVKAGDVLVRLSDVQSRAQMQILNIRTRIAQATEARLRAERSMADTLEFPAALLADQRAEVKAAIADQRDIFQDRASILQSQTNILKSRIEQMHREIDGLELQKVSFLERVDILKKQLDRLKNGLDSGVVQTNLVSTREEEYVEVKTNIGRIETEITKVYKSIGETEFQILQQQQQYKERASSEYKDISNQLQELAEHVKIAEDVLSRVEIRAPVDGTVQNMKFHTTGGVIKPGEVLMEIVPNDDLMIIKAQVSPIDIDSVQPGLVAEVRFSSFTSRFLPIIVGQVDTVSRATINPNDGRTLPYFEARINVSKDMVPDSIEGRLSAGMPAEIIITTGERTVADYLTSPLTDAIRKSMREE